MTALPTPIQVLQDGTEPAQLFEVLKLDPERQRAAGSLLGRQFCFDHIVLPLDVDQDYLTIGYPRDDAEFFTRLRDRVFKNLRVRQLPAFEIQTKLQELWPADTSPDRTTSRDRFFNDTILRGVELGSSEVIYQQEQECGFVRYFVNGIYVNDKQIARDEMMHMVENFSIEAFANYNKLIGQRGRIQRDLDGRIINLRVSSYPREFSDGTRPKLVMRILGRWEQLPSFSQIGMTEAQAALFLSHMRSKKCGIVVAAPTGEGKSTTIYAGLTHLAPEGANIYAIEDPPEIFIPFITTTRVNKESGWTFEHALTETLRQKPSFLFVGESLDVDTTNYAMRGMAQGIPSATSIHADDAIQAIGRLLDLQTGVDQIQRNVTLFVSQRLVNPVCTAIGCAEEGPPSPETIIRFKSIGMQPPHSVLHRKPGGCVECFHAGVKSKRIAIFEVIPMTNELRGIIEQTRNPARIAEVAYKKHKPMMAFAMDHLRNKVIDDRAFQEVPAPFISRITQRPRYKLIDIKRSRSNA